MGPSFTTRWQLDDNSLVLNMSAIVNKISTTINGLSTAFDRDRRSLGQDDLADAGKKALREAIQEDESLLVREWGQIPQRNFGRWVCEPGDREAERRLSSWYGEGIPRGCEFFGGVLKDGAGEGPRRVSGKETGEETADRYGGQIWGKKSG